MNEDYDCQKVRERDNRRRVNMSQPIRHCFSLCCELCLFHSVTCVSGSSGLDNRYQEMICFVILYSHLSPEGAAYNEWLITTSNTILHVHVRIHAHSIVDFPTGNLVIRGEHMLNVVFVQFTLTINDQHINFLYLR